MKKLNDRLIDQAPKMYDALVKTLELLQDGDAEPYQADALEALIIEILVNLEGPI
jgi:hypothetical protein